MIVIVAGAGGWLGDPSQAGAAGNVDQACDPNQLWAIVVESATRGLGACDHVAPPGPGEPVDRLHGAVVIDSDGRVIDNTGLSGSEKQSWLEQLAGRLWPCLAGETIGYKCTVAG